MVRADNCHVYSLKDGDHDDSPDHDDDSPDDDEVAGDNDDTKATIMKPFRNCDQRCGC